MIVMYLKVTLVLPLGAKGLGEVDRGPEQDHLGGEAIPSHAPGPMRGRGATGTSLGFPRNFFPIIIYFACYRRF